MKKEDFTVIKEFDNLHDDGQTMCVITDYSPKTIKVSGREYILNYPLRCLSTKEEGCYVIENEQLDIIGTGLTLQDAEKSINEEFDFLYSRLNTLGNNELSNRLVRVKRTINDFVKEIR